MVFFMVGDCKVPVWIITFMSFYRMRKGGFVSTYILMFQSLLACHPGGIHSHTILNIPEYISDEAKSFLKEVSSCHCGLHRPGYLVF